MLPALSIMPPPLFHLLSESHLKHAICFIKHHHLHSSELEARHLSKVMQQTTCVGRQEMHAGCEEAVFGSCPTILSDIAQQEHYRQIHVIRS